MSKSLTVNSANLDLTVQKMRNIKNNINEIFNNIDKIMDNINDNDNWSGDTNKEYYDRYLLLKEYFPKIIAGINNHITFLALTSENYQTAEHSLNSSVEDNLDNLNVN